MKLDVGEGGLGVLNVGVLPGGSNFAELLAGEWY